MPYGLWARRAIALGVAMALAGHKLDLYVLGESPLDDCTQALRGLLDTLGRKGVVNPAGRPCAPDVFVVGGVARVRIDAHDGPRFYSNTKGGFSVTCEGCNHNVTGPFASALTRWREGGRSPQAAATTSIQCPRCHRETPLTRMACRPTAGFGWGALVLHDVGSTRLSEDLERRLAKRLGGYRIVGSRA